MKPFHIADLDDLDDAQVDILARRLDAATWRPGFDHDFESVERESRDYLRAVVQLARGSGQIDVLAELVFSIAPPPYTTWESLPDDGFLQEEQLGEYIARVVETERSVASREFYRRLVKIAREQP